MLKPGGFNIDCVERLALINFTTIMFTKHAKLGCSCILKVKKREAGCVMYMKYRETHYSSFWNSWTKIRIDNYFILDGLI